MTLTLHKFAERLNISEGSLSTKEILTANYTTIINRESLTKLQVNKEGKLTVINSLGSKIYYFLWKDEVDSKVQAAVTEVLEAIGLACLNCEEEYKNLLTTLFSTKDLYFQRLSQRVYDRAKLPRNIIKALNPELWQRSEQFAKLYTDPKIHYNSFFHSEEEYKFRKDSVEFAQDLGVSFKRNKEGTSGSYKCKDYKGKTLLLFKPSTEGPAAVSGNPHLFIKIRNFFLDRIPYLRRRTCFLASKSYIAEMLASLVDRKLKLGVVPYTNIETLADTSFYNSRSGKSSQKTGSLQIWVDPHDLYSSVKPPDDVNQDPIKAFRLIEWLPMFLQKGRIEKNKALIQAALPKEELDKWAFIHILTGNSDGHPGNGKIVKIPKKDCPGEYESHFVALDFGWSWPIFHPDDYFSLKFMYDFMYLPGSEKPFGKEIQKIAGLAYQKFMQISKEISAVYTALASTNQELKDGTEFGFFQAEAMWQRLLRICWTIDNEKSIKDCVKVRTHKEFLKFMQENPDYAKLGWMPSLPKNSEFRIPFNVLTRKHPKGFGN